MEKGSVIIPVKGMYKGQRVTLTKRGFNGWLGNLDHERDILIFPDEMPSRVERKNLKPKRRRRR